MNNLAPFHAESHTLPSLRSCASFRKSCLGLDVEALSGVQKFMDSDQKGLISLFQPHCPERNLEDGAETQSGQQLLRETQQGQKPSQETAYSIHYKFFECFLTNPFFWPRGLVVCLFLCSRPHRKTGRKQLLSEWSLLGLVITSSFPYLSPPHLSFFLSLPYTHPSQSQTPNFAFSSDLIAAL